VFGVGFLGLTCFLKRGFEFGYLMGWIRITFCMAPLTGSEDGICITVSLFLFSSLHVQYGAVR
jgi:hypothetical protein